MNQELKTVFKNSGITILIIFAYGLIIRQNSVYIASTLGAILSIWNLYSMYKDAEVLVYKKNASIKQGMASYSKRYLINGLFLGIMMYVNLQWLIAGALGLLVVKLNILLIMFSHQLNNIIKKLKI